MTAIEKAIQIISAKGGTIRTAEAISAGIHPRTLYTLRDNGTLEKLARGTYRLAKLDPVSEPDLALIAATIPNAVVCLISALALHDLTSQIPHVIHLAIARTARYPVSREIPISVYRYAPASFTAGVDSCEIGGACISVFNQEKTITDCFKYRNKIGLDVAIEALSIYSRKPGKSLQRVLEYAKINRVSKVIRPYLEASL